MKMGPQSGPPLSLLLVVLFTGILTMWAPGFLAVGPWRACVFVLGIWWVLAAAFRPPTIHWSPAAWALVPAAVWPLVQLAAGSTINRWETWNALWNWLAYFVCFFLVLQHTSTAAGMKRFLTALLFFSLILSGVSLAQMFTSDGRIFWIFPSGYTNFVLGPFVYRNQYSSYIELTLPLALFFALFSKTDRTPYAVGAALMMGSVIACASRAGAVLVVVEALAVPLAAWRMRLLSGRQLCNALARMAAFLAVAAVVVGAGSVWKRLAEEDPLFLRRDIFNSAVQMFRDRPGMGYGLGTWATAYPSYATFDPGAAINQAHNDWLQWAAEGGAPFVGVLLVFAGLLLRPALRSVWGIGAIIVLLHCVVDYPLQQRPALSAMFFAVAGAIAADRNLSIVPTVSSTRRPETGPQS